jgi:hypothetical protein
MEAELESQTMEDHKLSVAGGVILALIHPVLNFVYVVVHAGFFASVSAMIGILFAGILGGLGGRAGGRIFIYLEAQVKKEQGKWKTKRDIRRINKGKMP